MNYWTSFSNIHRFSVNIRVCLIGLMMSLKVGESLKFLVCCNARECYISIEIDFIMLRNSNSSIPGFECFAWNKVDKVVVGDGAERGIIATKLLIIIPIVVVTRVLDEDNINCVGSKSTDEHFEKSQPKPPNLDFHVGYANK